MPPAVDQTLLEAKIVLSSQERPHDLIAIRDEQPGDMAAVREVNREAFDSPDEGRIVDALRAHGGVLLSLVAVADGEVVGHIMFSPLTAGAVVGAALGPMAVLPPFQRQGIGSQLVRRGVERLQQRACPFIVVIGHPEFYQRFGFEPAGGYGLTCEWDVPPEALMVAVLEPEISRRLTGAVRFRPEFATAG